jgi:hypothetical protein
VATVASLAKEQCFGNQIWRADFVKNPGFCCLPDLGSNFGFGLSSMLPPLTHSFYLGAYCGGSQLMLRPERERGVKKKDQMKINLFAAQHWLPVFLPPEVLL